MSSGCVGSENIPNLCCNNCVGTTDIVKSVRVALHIYTHYVIVFIVKKKKTCNVSFIVRRKKLKEATTEKGQLSKMISTNLRARISNLKSLYKLKPNFNTPT